MISGATTLFSWTLRMDSKSIAPHIVRAGFAMIILLAVGTTLGDVFGVNRAGLEFFKAICFLNFLLITVSGVSYFVSALTEEKDSGTFALLQLAGMTSLAITLGKSTSRLVTSLMLLVIQLPFTLLSITLGGILWQQVIAAYLALAAWMILVANLALFCSARCATSGRAAGLCGAILLMYFFLPVICGQFLVAVPPGKLNPVVSQLLSELPVLFATISVNDRLSDILQIGGDYSLITTQFWASCGLGAFLFTISTVMLNYWTRPSESGGSESTGALRRWSLERVWKLPIAWKEFHFYTGGRSFFLSKLLGGFILLAGFYILQQNETGEWHFNLRKDLGWNAFLTFVSILSVELVLYSSGCLFHEIRQSTQSTLAMAPYTPVMILLEKALGCLIGVLPSLILVGITFLVGYSGIVRNMELLTTDQTEPSDLVITYILLMALSCHIAALLSLYTRWAALPLTALLTFTGFFCLAAPIYLIGPLTRAFARSQHVPMVSTVSWLVTAFWVWLLVLLPLQIWIRDRWIAVSRQ